MPDLQVTRTEQSSSITRQLGQMVGRVMSRYGLWCVLLGLLGIASIASPYFFTYRNITNVLRQISIMGVLAVGMTFVILTGGIDLSVGSVMALSCVLVAVLAPRLGNIIPLVMAGCLIAGTVVGFVTGAIITFGRLQPFITTLGMSAIAEGFAFILTDGRPIIMSDLRWAVVGSGHVLGVPIPVIIFLTVVSIGQLVLSMTAFGTYVYALGGNEEAARLSGVNTRRYKTLAYVISGALAALGGIMMAGRLTVGDPGVGSGYSLDVIAAVVVGGNRMGGGFGSVSSSLLGAVIIGILNNLFNLLNISPYPQMVFKGCIIIGAVLLEELRKGRQG